MTGSSAPRHNGFPLSGRSPSRSRRGHGENAFPMSLELCGVSGDDAQLLDFLL
jgi:hypothetical protein